MAAQPKGPHCSQYNDENSSVSDTSVDERMTYYDDEVMQYTTYNRSTSREELHGYAEDEGDEEETQPPPIYDDYVLDGCRWMFQRASGQFENSEDAEDPYTDAFETWQIQMNQNCRDFQTEVDRRADVVLDVLKKIKAFSHDDLVKGYLFCTDEYFGGSTEFAGYDQKVTSTLKSILDRSGIMSATPFRFNNRASAF